MPKASAYLEAALTEAPAIIAVIKELYPAVKDFITQQKSVLGPYATTIKTDVAALKSADALMKLPKVVAIAEDLFDVWPLLESAYGEIATLVTADYGQLKTSVTNVIGGTIAAPVAPVTAIAPAPAYTPEPAPQAAL